MAQLVVTPCATCGAPLEFADASAVELRCPFCGTVNNVARPTAKVAAVRGPVSIVLMTIVFISALPLFALGMTALGDWINGGDADHVFSLSEQGAADAPQRVLYASHAARMPDGSLWLACTTSPLNLLCGVDQAGGWLGTIELPRPDLSLEIAASSQDLKRGMAADRAGRLYVSYGAELLEVSVSERRVVGRVDVLPPGERPGCLAVAPDDSLVMMTSEDDLVELDSTRQVHARWHQPLLQQDARHHGCAALTHDAAGQVWIVPEGAPAIYVFARDGAFVRRHVPGGTGHYVGLAVLADGSVVTGYGQQLLSLGPNFVPRPGPTTARYHEWGEVSEIIRTPADDLIITTETGTVARWERASSRW